MLTPVHDTLHEPWTTPRLFEGLKIQTEGRHSIRIESSMSGTVTSVGALTLMSLRYVAGTGPGFQTLSIVHQALSCERHQSIMHQSGHVEVLVRVQRNATYCRANLGDLERAELGQSLLMMRREAQN